MASAKASISSTPRDARRKPVYAALADRALFDVPPPAWVQGLVGGGETKTRLEAGAGPFEVRMTESSCFTLVSVRVTGAASMDAGTFERWTAEAYGAIAQVMTARPA